jgi:hypothetical protein
MSDRTSPAASQARDDAGGRPMTLPMVRELLDKLRVTVPPSDRPTPVTFERYASPPTARRAADGDPDALVVERPDGGAVVIRLPGGLSLVGSYAESV